jgi:CheY-like chemotaxis protein
MAAARQGDRSHARMFLAKVTELDPDDAYGWLWRAGLAEEAEQALVWLNRALDIDPDLPQARRALPIVRIQAGIAIARCGDFPTARELFHLAAEADPVTIIPWLELASLSRSPEEARTCLNEVLSRQPDHAGARECLERFDRERQAAIESPTPQSLDLVPPPLPKKKPLFEDDPRDDRLIPVSFEPPPEFADPSAPRSASRAAPGPQKGTQSASTILIVDDNADVRAFIHRHLEPLGVRVISANGADETFKLLRDPPVPDLILIDGVMPGVDGFELCALLRKDKATARVPMVLLAMKTGVLASFKGLTSGFNDTLAKPISPISLRAMVGKYCTLPADEDTESWPELPEEILR